jgi:integrase
VGCRRGSRWAGSWFGSRPGWHGRSRIPIGWPSRRSAALTAWRAGAPRPGVAVWTPQQTGQFLDSASDDRLYALHHLIAFRGLRRGEAVGLPWYDVALENARLVVSQQIVQLGWATMRAAPKTDNGARVVALDTGTVAVLRAHRARQFEERLRSGPAWDDSGLVFTREDGSALHPDYVSRHFVRLARAADLPPVRLHDLRHGAASLALAGGASLKEVSEMLGHSSITITADIYTSVLPGLAHGAAERAAALVPRTLEKLGPQLAPMGAEDTSCALPRKERDQVRGGAPPGTRTPNPQIKSLLLCQLS